MPKPLILIDGSSYLYRAFHAMPSLTNSKGFPTGAIYGVTNMLRKLLTDYDPDFVAVVFDSKEKTFREEIYPKYKENRPPMPDDLIQQIKDIHEIIRAMGLPLIIIDGVEADDVIGTLAKQAEQRRESVLISTGDKDLAQLVNHHITLINTMTNTILDPEGVKVKFGIPATLIIDYLALVGDNVDNIPGVPQVGPKTAVKWLNQYGSLEDIIINANAISGKVGENLRASLQQLPLAKMLATIKTDLDLPPNDLKRQLPNEEKLTELYKELEFKTWLNELLEKNKSATEEKYLHYQTILQEDDWKKWLSELTQTDIFVIDVETTSLNYMEAELVGISFVIEKSKAIYIPLAHDYANAPLQLSREKILADLKSLLENPKIKKIGHNIKYDIEILANYGIEVKGVAFDTMLESYILDSSYPNHDMDSLALKYLAWRTIRYEDVVRCIDG